MSNFVYDEMVTAQSLNEIAVDLGAGDFSQFSNNTPYAVGKLNEITQALIGSGISSSLNQFKITVNESNVVIGTGIAFFPSGKKLKLTAPVTLPFQVGELYLYEKLSTGVVSINIGELPADNYVHLATINEDATFTDRRMTAKAKVLLPTEGSSYSFTESYSTSLDANTLIGKRITIPIKDVSKIFLVSRNQALGIFDIQSQTFSGMYIDNYGNKGYKYEDDSCAIYIRSGSYDLQIYLSIETITEETVIFKYTLNRIAMPDVDLTVDFYVFGGVEK